MSTALTWVLLTVLGFTASPCPTEDTVPEIGACYWDAAVQGNGQGDGFVTFDNGFRIYHRELVNR